MSEGQNPIERATHKIRGKYYEAIGLTPESYPGIQRDVASEKRAKLAVEQYLKMSSQEPMATFLADSASTIDLSNYQQGTVIRVEQYFPLSDHPETPSYRWFVFGDRKGDSVYIYDVSFLDKPSHLPKLPAEGKLQIFAESPVKLHSFPVADAEFVLADQEKLFPDPEERKSELERCHKNMPVQRVDVMSFGKTSKARERNPQKEIRRELVTEVA